MKKKVERASSKLNSNFEVSNQIVLKMEKENKKTFNFFNLAIEKKKP
jgi:hypothetical protein